MDGNDGPNNGMWKTIGISGHRDRSLIFQFDQDLRHPLRI